MSVIEFSGFFTNFKQAGSLALTYFILLICDLDIRLLGKITNCVGEFQILGLDQVFEDISAFATTEAMIEL